MALSIDTTLPTPTGWTTVGDVQVGDYLIDELGYGCRVTSVSDVYKTEGYQLAFGWGKRKKPEKGGLIKASKDQKFKCIKYRKLQKLSNPSERKDYAMKGVLNEFPDNWPIMTFGKMGKPIAEEVNCEQMSQDTYYARKHGTHRPPQMHYNYSTPITKALKVTSRELDTLHPYLLGVLLNYYNFEKRTLDITLEWYPYLRDNFKKLGGYDLIMVTEVGERSPRGKHVSCIPVGLWDVGFDENRRIPMRYLRAKRTEREELLAGLTDKVWSAGTETNRARTQVEFSHLCDELVFDTLDLVRGLGYAATLISARTEEAARGHNKLWVNWYPTVPPQAHPKLWVRNIKNTMRAGHDLERYLWKLYSCDKLKEPVSVRKITVDSDSKMYSASKLLIPVMADD